MRRCREGKEEKKRRRWWTGVRYLGPDGHQIHPASIDVGVDVVVDEVVVVVGVGPAASGLELVSARASGLTRNLRCLPSIRIPGKWKYSVITYYYCCCVRANEDGSRDTAPTDTTASTRCKTPPWYQPGSLRSLGGVRRLCLILR